MEWASSHSRPARDNGEDEEEFEEEEAPTLYVRRNELVETSYDELLPLRPWQLTRQGAAHIGVQKKKHI